MGEIEDEVFLAPREVASSRMELSTAAVVHKVPSLRSHVEGRSTGTRLLEEPVENSDDEDFGGFEAGPNLGLGKEPGSLLNYLRAQRDRVTKSRHCYA